MAVSVGHGSFQGLHKVKTTVMVILRRESPFSPRFSQGVGQGSPEAGDTMTLVTAAHWVDPSPGHLLEPGHPALQADCTVWATSGALWSTPAMLWMSKKMQVKYDSPRSSKKQHG